MTPAVQTENLTRRELLIMDEPFSGLDPLMREEVCEGLRVTAAERTVLISSHEVEEVERLADWVVVIDQGRLVCAEPLAASWRWRAPSG